MKIAYWSIAWMSVTDGPGNRLVVYMQGCPIKCPWCHSPHSRYLEAPLFMNKELCCLCGRCEQVCRNKVHSITDSKHLLKRENCEHCGACIDACPLSDRNSMNSVLRLPTVREEVFDLFEMLRPQLEILRTHGGITLSGGEALMQKDGVIELLKLCKEHHIHTCVETSMMLSEQTYSEVAEYVDCWLLGFRKIYLPNKCSQEEILMECHKQIACIRGHANPELIARFPIIKGYTDTIHILKLLKKALLENSIEKLELLPCNRHMNFYYELIGETGLEVEKCIPSEEDIHFIQNYFIQEKIKVTVV